MSRSYKRIPLGKTVVPKIKNVRKERAHEREIVDAALKQDHDDLVADVDEFNAEMDHLFSDEDSY
jgi:hypothetical protein